MTILDIKNRQDKEKIMSKLNSRNEILKRQFQKYCKNSKGYSDKSIGYYMNALYEYEKFTNYQDFSKFNDDSAIAFKEYLKKKINPRTKKPIALSTVKDHLRYLKLFFEWLSNQAGYKRAIIREHVECLRLSRAENAMASKPQRTKYPTIEMVKKVVSMPVHNEVDMRDRAIISFTLLSGGRADSIVSLPLKCFNPDQYEISYSVDDGVRTKFSKTFISFLYRFDKQMINYVKEWYDYLIKDKLYSLNDPLFPRSKVEQVENNKSFDSATSVDRVFWGTIKPIENIFKRRFTEAGLEYYSPHSFRHLANHLLKQKCKTIEEFQAVSQNFGHESMGTTFSSYAKLPDDRVKELIKNLDFSDNENNYDKEMAEALMSVLKKFNK